MAGIHAGGRDSQGIADVVSNVINLLGESDENSAVCKFMLLSLSEPFAALGEQVLPTCSHGNVSRTLTAEQPRLA